MESIYNIFLEFILFKTKLFRAHSVLLLLLYDWKIIERKKQKKNISEIGWLPPLVDWHNMWPAPNRTPVIIKKNGSLTHGRRDKHTHISANSHQKLNFIWLNEVLMLCFCNPKVIPRNCITGINFLVVQGYIHMIFNSSRLLDKFFCWWSPAEESY